MMKMGPYSRERKNLDFILERKNLTCLKFGMECQIYLQVTVSSTDCSQAYYLKKG